MFTKDSYRKTIKERRMMLSGEEVASASNAVATQLFAMPDYQAAKTVYLYLPIKNEIDTLPILENALANNKVVAAPVVINDKEMEFYSIFDTSDLKKGAFGILEPSRDLKVEAEDPFVIVPGVAFDLRKNRLGYGAGYYDRYFAKYPKALKIALAYEFQLVDAFETDEHDVKMDMIITNQQIII